MKKTLLVFFLAIGAVLLATAEFVSAQDEFGVAVEPKIAVNSYQVKTGDSLSKIFRSEYGRFGSAKELKTLAAWKKQVTHPKFWVFVGQRLEIPKPLIMTQTRAGVAPTTLPRDKAMEKAAERLPRSMAEAGINASIPASLLKMMKDGLKNSKKTVDINGQTYAVVTFAKYAQGWTKVSLKKGELSGRSTLTRLDKRYALRTIHARQCNNIYLQLLRLIPPPPPVPPPPPRVRNPRLQLALNQIYQEAKAPAAELDMVGGGAKMKYTDGAKDLSYWGYAALRLPLGTDAEGNRYSGGPYARLSGYWGDWRNPSNSLATPVDFRGSERHYGAEFRRMSPDAREYIARLGYFEGDEHKESSDIWGSTDFNAKYRGVVGELGAADYSRLNEVAFPKWKATVGYMHQTSMEYAGAWTSKSGQVIMLSDKPFNRGGSFIDLEADFLQEPKKRIKLSGEIFGKTGNDRSVGIGTLYVNFFDETFAIGPRFSAANYDGQSVTGKGFAWRIDPYSAYKYFVNSSDNP